jgi:hypothetical protein
VVIQRGEGGDWKQSDPEILGSNRTCQPTQITISCAVARPREQTDRQRGSSILQAAILERQGTFPGQ